MLVENRQEKEVVLFYLNSKVIFQHHHLPHQIFFWSCLICLKLK